MVVRSAAEQVAVDPVLCAAVGRGGHALPRAARLARSLTSQPGARPVDVARHEPAGDLLLVGTAQQLAAAPGAVDERVTPRAQGLVLLERARAAISRPGRGAIVVRLRAALHAAVDRSGGVDAVEGSAGAGLISTEKGTRDRGQGSGDHTNSPTKDREDVQGCGLGIRTEDKGDTARMTASVSVSFFV